MTIQRLLAQATVSDLNASRDWYSQVFDRGPDANPMDGLLEWHLADTFGVQVWLEPARSGHSSIILEGSDLDSLTARLDERGIANSGPEQATSSRILRLDDPDGNRLVFTDSA